MVAGKYKWLKRLLGDQNSVNHKLVNGLWLDQHDQDHLEVAALPPIYIKGFVVNGINGIDIPEFHPQPITPQYPGEWDEARVAIHQAMRAPTVLGVLRAACWCKRLATWGINPVSVLLQHHRSFISQSITQAI